MKRIMSRLSLQVGLTLGGAAIVLVCLAMLQGRSGLAHLRWQPPAPSAFGAGGDRRLTTAGQDEVKVFREMAVIDQAPEPNDPEEIALRQARGSRYDGRGATPLTETPEGERLSSALPWLMPRLPARQSDAIVLGAVIDAQPHLSNDKTSIYTELSVRVEEVIKNDDREPVSPGDSIVVEREGGALWLPAGRVLKFGVRGQGLPRAGERYLLFLKRNDQGKDFLLLRAYESRGGRFFALDEMWPRYKSNRLSFQGSDETAFLDEVRDAVKHSRRSDPGSDGEDDRSQASQCPTIPPDTRGKGGAWLEDAIVAVNIAPNFSAAERQIITTVFRNWQAASGPPGNYSGVTFKFTYNSTPISGGDTFQINKKVPDFPNQNDRAAVRTNARPDLSGLEWAQMDINPNYVLNPGVVAHEVGHTFGLDHCPACPRGTSVMQESNDLPGPGSCDNAAVKSVGQYGQSCTGPLSERWDITTNPMAFTVTEVEYGIDGNSCEWTVLPPESVPYSGPLLSLGICQDEGNVLRQKGGFRLLDLFDSSDLPPGVTLTTQFSGQARPAGRPGALDDQVEFSFTINYNIPPEPDDPCRVAGTILFNLRGAVTASNIVEGTWDIQDEYRVICPPPCLTSPPGRYVGNGQFRARIGNDCNFSISPTEQSFPAAGGTGSVAVTASRGDCAWTASNNGLNWITVTSPAGGSGAGSGMVSYSVAANPGTSPRTGILSIAGREFTITQAGCAVSISPPRQFFLSAGGAGNIAVTAPSGCCWTARSNVAWVGITAGGSGCGDGTISYSVAPNGTTEPRTGTITVGNREFTVEQSWGIVTPVPDLRITKSHAGNFVAGNAGVYTLTVTNVGSATATGAITVTDTLPERGLSYISGVGVGWSCAPNFPTVTCVRSGPLAPGESSVIRLRVNVFPEAVPSVTNCARVTTAGDANPANDLACDPTTAVLATRIVRVVSTNAGSNGTVSVPIELVAQGDESALGFSLSYPTTALSQPRATVGSGADGAMLFTNSDQTAQGNFGIALALPAGQTFAAGTRQMVVVSFSVAAVAAPTRVTLEMTDDPVFREVADVNGNALVASFLSGTVDISPGGETTLLSENFSSGIPPAWTVIDGGSRMGDAWTTANPGARAINAPFAPAFVVVDSAWAGSNATQDEQLITPAFNARGCGRVILEFDSQFRWWGGGRDEFADVDVSTDGGSGWLTVVRMQGANDGYPAPVTKAVDITQAMAANPGNVKLRFRYHNANWEWWWAIDNVRVKCGAASPDFGLRLDPPAINVLQTSSASSSVTISPIGGFNRPVQLSCEQPLPPGVTCSFSPATVTPPPDGASASLLTVSAAATAPPGLHLLGVKATSDLSSRAVSFRVTVQPRPTFALACQPDALTAPQGGVTQSNCTLTSTGGFNSPVNLFCQNLPLGAQCGFSPNPVTAPANGAAGFAQTVSVDANVAPGTYGYRVLAAPTNGLTLSFDRVLTVTPSPPPGPAPEQEPNELPSQANALQLPGGRTGAAAVGDATAVQIVYTNGDRDGIEDLFAVTLTESVRLDLSLSFANAAADLDLFLLRIVGNSVSVLGVSNSGTATTERIVTSSALAPGVYYVGVSAWRGLSGYTLTVARAGNIFVPQLAPAGGAQDRDLKPPRAEVALPEKRRRFKP